MTVRKPVLKMQAGGYGSLRSQGRRQSSKDHENELRRHPAGGRVPRGGESLDRGECAEAIRARPATILARPHPNQGREPARRRNGLAEEKARPRLALSALAKGLWRPRLESDRAR